MGGTSRKKHERKHEKRINKEKQKDKKFIYGRNEMWRKYFDWYYIETLNKGLGVSKKNSYVDSNGYLRWKANDRLVHRDIAKQCIYNKKSFALPFSCYEVHHKNRNELDNNLSNLEILNPEEHALVHAGEKKKEKTKKAR